VRKPETGGSALGERHPKFQLVVCSKRSCRFATFRQGHFALEHHAERRVEVRGLYASQKERNAMKTFVSALAMVLAIAFTGSAFAGDVASAKTKADCHKAGGMWDAKTSTCGPKKM